MAQSGQQIYEWDKQPRMPLPAPRKSCDCQGLEKFPPRPNPPYPPIESATFTEAQRMLGFDRGVIVHSAIYAAIIGSFWTRFKVWTTGIATAALALAAPAMAKAHDE